MMNRFQSVMVASVVGCTFACTISAKTLTIGVDLSGSNPLLSDPHFAKSAGAYITQKITSLSAGDVVRLRSFGARNDARNLRTAQTTLSRKNRPQKVAKQISAYLRGLPERSKAQAQSSTNLIGWLEFTSGFDCAGGGQILVITDGLESSTLVSGTDLLAGKTALPKAHVSLKGCEITFYGLGAGWPVQEVRNIRDAWRTWMGQAGASFSFEAP